MVCCPNLLYNFIYRLPNMAEALTPLGFMDLIRYFCARDLIISEVQHCAVPSSSTFGGRASVY